MADTITLETPDGPMDVFVARPGGSGPSPSLVIVQEAFGVNAHIQSVCERFAASGYVAMAPELYHRQGRGVALGYDDPSRVRPYMSSLTNEGIASDVGAAVAAARGDGRVDTSRIGVVGFCVGGFSAFLTACRSASGDLRAVVSFYGGGIVRERPGLQLRPVVGEAGSISAPILCFFGGQDAMIPESDVSAIRQALEASRKDHRIVVYPEAGHGFFCDARASYHRPSAEDAWNVMLDWLSAA